MTKRDANGTAYDASGPDSAPVVVLIHGLGLNRHCWQWHVPLYAARYRVVSYDLYGHGESAAPPRTPDMSLFSEQLRDLMDHLTIESAAIVGFSLGGMINRRFVMDNPGRASAFAILNSPHERGDEAQRLVEERAEKSQAGGPGATLDATIERWFTARYIAANPDVIAMVREWVLANDHEHYAQCRRVLAHGVKELIRPQPPITTPTIVITAENDSGSTPAMSHAIASEIRDAETVIVPHLQHMGLVEDPDAFTAPVLAFLDQLAT